VLITIDACGRSQLCGQASAAVCNVLLLKTVTIIVFAHVQMCVSTCFRPKVQRNLMHVLRVFYFTVQKCAGSQDFAFRISWIFRVWNPGPHLRTHNFLPYHFSVASAAYGVTDLIQQLAEDAILRFLPQIESGHSPANSSTLPTDWQTPRLSIAIVRIAYIQCSPELSSIDSDKNAPSYSFISIEHEQMASAR